MKTWVSIVDDNIINHNALRLLVDSVIACNANSPEFVVLASRDSMPTNLSAWLRRKNVEIELFDWTKREDPYEIKLLLTEFAQRRSVELGDFLYLDPDHISIRPLEISSLEKMFIVSSEYNTHDDSLVGAHYNTSLVCGKLECWLRMKDLWRTEYNYLKKEGVSLRYLEELSFSSAAISAGIMVAPCQPEIQSNFSINIKDYSLFHYGGEYREAKEIKKCLYSSSLMDVLGKLKDLSSNATSALQRNLVLKMLDLFL